MFKSPSHHLAQYRHKTFASLGEGIFDPWWNLAAENQAVVRHTRDGWQLDCRIQELDREVFSLSLLMPDQATAEAARDAFIHKGGDFYKILLAMFSGNETLAAEWLQKL